MYFTDQFKQSVAIPEYANLKCKFLGLDSEEHCFNKNHFANYEPISYEFNELGYRHGNPTRYQGNEILAIGDSFTLGLGVNQSDTWPECLARLLNYPVLNFSLNGASNDWIARKTSILLKHFQPKCVILHYSFTHRRENSCQEWTDVERTQCEPLYADEENFSNWQTNYNKITETCGSIPVIHTAIVNWHAGDIPNVSIPKQIDWARDGFHYGRNTNLNFATSLLEFVSRQSL